MLFGLVRLTLHTVRSAVVEAVALPSAILSCEAPIVQLSQILWGRGRVGKVNETTTSSGI
jgi:hypothetical protein